MNSHVSPTSVDVLVVTAVDVELQAVRTRLVPSSTHSKYAVGSNTYYVGTIGRYKCAVMMTEAGSGGTGGSALAVYDALRHVEPAYVIMVGIAFGRDENSQTLGDLLIAKYVIPYELQRAGVQLVPRASHPEAGPTLVNRARNLGWTHQIDTAPARKPIFGALLSGEKLIDDPTVKASLFAQFPQAIGGEMEAAGVASACLRGQREWIVAKSICDWGDGNKDKRFQSKAAAIAADFLASLLEEEGLNTQKHSLPTVPITTSTSLNTADQTRASMRADLESAHEEHDRLARLGQPTDSIDKYLVDLKRTLREGGHLGVGDILGSGRYILVAEVGAGGFATVWRAIDRTDRNVVAVKVLHPQYARDETRRDRFFRGAKRMADLNHRAVVSVLLPYAEDGGWFFFVMEYLPRGDLSRLVQNGKLSAAEALRVVLTAAEGLEAAHSMGMVHRDVCPENILVREDGSGVLTDFDLVRAPNTTAGTRTAAMGRYVYAAPEAMEDAAEAEASADVYGLGMSAVFSLYGRALSSSIVREPQKVLAAVAPSRLLRRVLAKSISWQAKDRFQSAREFREALVAAISSAERKHPADQLQGCSVLVVDDEQFIRDILADFLGMEGARSSVAASEADARHVIATKAIDVVVVDLKLDPTKRSSTSSNGGISLMKWAAAMPTPPKFIIMTAYPAVESAVEAMKLGAFDYIVKPFKVEEVVDCIARAFGST